MGKIVEIVYTWKTTGREEVRYRRPAGSQDAQDLMDEVDNMRRIAEDRGYKSPYSYRIIETD